MARRSHGLVWPALRTPPLSGLRVLHRALEATTLVTPLRHALIDKGTKIGTMIPVALFSRHSIFPCPESLRCSEPPA